MHVAPSPPCPRSFKSADVAYVLAYSVIMLNTDAHNPQVGSGVEMPLIMYGGSILHRKRGRR